MGDPLERLRRAARDRESAGLRRALRPRTADHDGLIDLASNDYLGLSTDQRLIEGAVRATRDWGTGAGGSRLVTGTTELHAELDARLAAFVRTARPSPVERAPNGQDPDGQDPAERAPDGRGPQAGLVFSSGFLANLGAVAGLCPAGSLVVSDQVNHASIVDACRLSRARVVITGHRDVAAVEGALADRDEENAVVVTDSVFSVDGDLAPLRDLHAVVRRHRALLIVDEAHAFGVVGPCGQGAAQQAGIAGEPDVVLTLSLSKSLGSQGGAVLGATEVVETLIDTGRAFIFDTGLNPASVGAALAALDVIAAEPGLPARARDNARRISGIAAALGLETTDPAAAVVPVFLGEPRAALRAAEICAEHGARVGCFRPPSVPKGRACLRLTARASLTEAELTVLTEALSEIARQPGRTLLT